MRLDQYFNLLGKPYKTDFIVLYEKLIRQYMDANTGRSKYMECCAYIVAKAIVNDWRKKFPRRRTMQEELARYKW